MNKEPPEFIGSSSVPSGFEVVRCMTAHYVGWVYFYRTKPFVGKSGWHRQYRIESV